MNLPEFSVRRPVTVLMLLAVIVIFGLVAYFRLPLKMVPDGFTGPFMHVYVPYPSSTPVEVMNQIAIPLEDELATVSNIKVLNSNSSTRGAAVWIEFNQGTDMDVAYQEVTDRIERVRPDLPDEIDHIYVRKWNPNDQEVLSYAINPPDDAEDPAFVIKNYLEPRIQRIDGVAKIEFYGLDEKSIIIEADIDKIQQHKVNFYQLLQKIRRDNFILSSGYLREGDRKSYVITSARFDSLDEIRNLPIGVKDLKLKDIAKVTFDVPEKDYIYHVNRKPGISMEIFKESGANTVDVCADVRQRINELFEKETALSGYEQYLIWDQGAAIKSSLTDLQMSGMFGGLFAMLIVYLFLRRFRLTLIVSLSIPFSMLMAVMGLYFLGFSLDLLTLMGLMLAVGMLVDNAIVVSENIERVKSHGLDNRTAAVEGAAEVGLAITLATLTTIVVFLPMMLMGNDMFMRLFLQYVGISIILALVSSLFVALVLIPFATSHIMKKREQNGQSESGKTVLNHSTGEAKHMGHLTGPYEKMLRWALAHKRALFLIVALILLSTTYPAGHVRSVGDMEGGPRRVGMRVTVPSHLSLEEREAFLDEIEGILYDNKEDLELKTVTSWGNMHRIWINTWLIDEKESEKDVMDIMKRIKELLPERPGVSYRFRGDHNSAEGGTVNVYFYGKDISVLKRIAESANRQLRNINGVISADIDMEDQSDEIVARVKRQAAVQRGIRPIEIESTISSVLRPTQLPKYMTPDREIDVQLRFNEENRDSLERVKSLQLSSNDRMLPIETLTTFSVQQGFQELSRRNKNTVLGVKITYSDVDMEAVGKDINRVMEGIEMPAGYNWSKGRRFAELEESDNAQVFGLLLAATFVLLLMGVLFESFILPFSIIVSVPLAFVGSYWLMWATDSVFTPMAATGTLILIGIVVNNGIVLIDHVNTLRKQGMPKLEAIVVGSRNRLRPILMTAFTTIMGLVPLAVGKASLVGIPYSPLAITVIGGLTTSTLLTLFVVPVVYSLLDSLRDYMGNLTWSLAGRDTTSGETASG